MTDTEPTFVERGPLVRPCAHCGRLSKNHYGSRLMCKPAMGRLRYKAGAEKHLYDVQGFPPHRTPTVEVEGSVVVDGRRLTFPVKAWTETPHQTSPHHGAVYVHLRFPAGNGPIDVANMEPNHA